MKNLNVVFILDMSGSMHDMAKDVIGGFNSLITSLKKEKDANIKITTVFFNGRVYLYHNERKLKGLHLLKDSIYIPYGTTALLDAIGLSIDKFKDQDLKDFQTKFYIMTDGYENSSNTYSYPLIKKMIKWQQEHEKWEFNFMASNIDAYKEDDKLGIIRENIVQSKTDTSEGTREIFKNCACSIRKSIKK